MFCSIKKFYSENTLTILKKSEERRRRRQMEAAVIAGQGEDTEDITTSEVMESEEDPFASSVADNT